VNNVQADSTGSSGVVSTDRIVRLKKQLIDDEDAFDLLCEYLPDAVAERCRQEWHLTAPQSQPCPSTKIVVTNKNKRSRE
jgi:hypothetical protein